MAIAVKDLIDAGVHFGHRASRWNPKMKPYIYGKRNLIHIIDLKETVRGALRASKYFSRIASQNGLILFVGTKRQAVDSVVENANRCQMPYVSERWLGGILTNFRTIRSRLERLEELEATLDSDFAATFSKKMIANLTRERKKIQRNLEGIRHMNQLPEALLVIDPRREHIAVAEARKLGIKVVAIMDTDCDPEIVDLPIPANDDSMRSIDLVVRHLTDAILEGRQAASAEVPPPVSEGDGRGGRDSRGRRGGGQVARGSVRAGGPKAGPDEGPTPEGGVEPEPESVPEKALEVAPTAGEPAAD
ncbi:MAG: 30S ribosomal protein S2 [Planctomycetota bacterium]|nr:30S ribosomal protein S2 [Planctomycetota bacterium]